MCYGYRLGEEKLPIWADVKSDFQASVPEVDRPGRRPPVQVGTGAEVLGWSLPHPDPSCPITLLGGVVKRFARKPPDPAPGELKKLGDFVRRFCRNRLVPLAHDEDVSFEHWLGNTNYPEWRREELREVHKKTVQWGPATLREAEVKLFMKDECYVAFKQARGINARADPMKCRLGPIFKAIETQVYSLPEFIKHVPVAQRAKYIQKMLYREGGVYLATDYESFEALFTREVMENCEFIMYDYMTQYLPCHAEFMDNVRRYLGGRNCLKNRRFRAWLRATRMSGEMCTSLGNGFSNLMFFYYLSERVGFKDPAIVVEGDDGLASGHGTPPTKEDFLSLGLYIKLEVHNRLNTASFCGLIFSEEDELVVTDPLKVLASFGWTSQQYARARGAKLKTLLRCKALSLAHQYPGCPIISSLAQFGLRVTAGHDVRRVIESKTFGWWERNQLRAAARQVDINCPVVPPMATRLLVQDKFGIGVSTQIRIESYLDGLVELQQLRLPELDHLVSDDWVRYYQEYTLSVNPKGPLEWMGYWAKRNRQPDDLLALPCVVANPR